ncbi:MAG: 23S rRNA (adenine(2503)-C(2))-methyltransferase RlmN [Thermodesulfobacteriota bacterium]|nr:23S rRNA (adenine(2503)-C(2))-methyltransferase RlmN [Thermodesulfobacteriota bacterium]
MNLLNLSFEEMEAFLDGLGEPRYRTDQVWQWLWQKGCLSFRDMTNIPKGLWKKLEESAKISRPRVQAIQKSRDGTVKFLLGLSDGALVETVLIPEKNRITQCLSCQVGCAMGCTFCATGQMGLTRNMVQSEILGQILVAGDYLKEQGKAKDLKNLVFMGMGEPLLNLKELMRSLTALNHERGLNFSPRRVTVSTVGVLKGLDTLGQSGLARLAVSLHAPTQDLREQIMPKAAEAPLDELMARLDRYPLKPRQRITFEYLLLGGVNDGPEHAKALARLLAEKKAKVNLIPFHASEGLPYKASDPDTVLAFEKILWDKGLTAVLRKSKGLDIAAACGQLKAALTS